MVNDLQVMCLFRNERDEEMKKKCFEMLGSLLNDIAFFHFRKTELNVFFCLLIYITIKKLFHNCLVQSIKMILPLVKKKKNSRKS